MNISASGGMKKSAAAMKGLGKGTKSAFKAGLKMIKKKKNKDGKVEEVVNEDEEMFGGALMEDPEGEDEDEND